MKNFRIDRAAVKTALRTACALMLGNGIVGPLLLGHRNWSSIVLLIALGLLVIMASSIERKE